MLGPFRSPGLFKAVLMAAVSPGDAMLRPNRDGHPTLVALLSRGGFDGVDLGVHASRLAIFARGHRGLKRAARPWRLATVLNGRGENENLEARSDYLLILPVMRKTAIFRPLSRKALKNQRPFPTLFVPPRLDGVTGLRKCAQLEDCLAVVFRSDGVT
jgi:hypothetical protein